jgi:RHS repeat-associated protein
MTRQTPDLNGDGRPDVARFVGPQSGDDIQIAGRIEMFVSTETSVAAAGAFVSKASRLDLLQGLSIWGDSNGDPYDPYADYHFGWIGTAETCRYTGAGAKCKTQVVGDSGVWNILDYDGDGRADVLAGSTSAGDKVRQNFGDGTRSTTDVAWTRDTSLPTSLWSLRGDFNGDSIPDTAYYDETTTRWTVHLYGYGSFPGLLASVTNGLGHVTKVQYAGMNDRSVYTPGTSAAYPNKDLTQGPPVVKLLQVSNGLGGNLEVAYKYSGLRTHLTGRGSLGFQKITVEDRVANTTTATIYSQTWPTIGMALSASVTHDSGVVLTQSTNTLSHFLTTASPLVRHAYVSKSVTTRKDLNGSLIGTTTSEIDTNGIDKTYGNVIASTETVADANNQTFTTKTATEFSNDDTNILWGLPTQISVSKSATGAPTIKRTTGRSYESPYGQLKTETVEPDDASTSLLKLTTTYARNPTFGQVTEKKLTWYDPVAQATKSRTVESVTAFDAKYRWPTTVKNAKLHAESATYSEAHGQPLSETDANALKTSWQYDGWGRKIREDRPDKTVTTWAYRKCTDLCGYSARGVVANITQQWARITLSGGTVEEQQTTVPTEVYLDVLGREVGTRTWGLTETIHTDRVFDANGRLVKLSRPHTFTQRDNGVYGWTEYVRDDLGRVTLMKATDRLGSGVDTTIFSYSGLTRTLTDANTGKRIEVRNGIGKITAITDALSNTVGYTYNTFGELLSTTDPLANQIKVEYDRLGRKTKLTDPDLGTWTYKVDPLGQTYEQTDARAKKTSFSFDELGRVTRKLETDSDNNWIYDTAATGIGELAESYTLIGSNKDYRRIHSYDAFGRPASTQTNLDWEYATLWTYDNYSRPKTESHRRRAIGATSGGVEQKVEFSYNRQGQVEKLFRSGNTTPMWTNRAQDALGRTTDELLDNTLETVHSFNTYTGRLETIRAGQDNAAAGSTATHQNDTYTYDPVGNLLTRAHLNTTSGARHSETFTYDALNRLKTAQVTGQPMRNFDYDALGNLTSKTGVGSFSYEQPAPVPMTMIYIDDDLFFPVPIKPAGGTPPPPTANVRPHAVKAITGNVAGVSNPRFSYDANGNLLAGLGRSYGWSGGNLPLTIDRQAGGITVERTEFTYGPDRQRTRQIRRAMSGTTPGAVQNTVYYGDGIEKEIDVAKNQTLIRTYLPQGIGYLEEVITGTAVPATASATANARYLLKDYLGSPILVTDASRSERQRMSYDAWGRRRQATGADDSWSSLGTISNGQDNTGYTGHEQLDTLGLVHMNERLYDPILGRHVSGDPTIPDPANLQSLNRYSYVLNNALAFVDPTGLAPDKVEETKPREVDGGNNADKQRRFDSEGCTGSRLCRVTEIKVQLLTLKNGDVIVALGDAVKGTSAVVAVTISKALQDVKGGVANAASYMAEKLGDFQGTEVGKILQGLPPEGMAVGGLKAGLSLLARLSKVEAASAVAAKETGVIANGVRGRASETRVLQELGISKNTKAVSTAEGRAIPDGMTEALSVEIKDSARVTATKQVRIETGAAKAAGHESVLVTGEKTCVSGRCTEAFDRIIRRSDLGPQ